MHLESSFLLRKSATMMLYLTVCFFFCCDHLPLPTSNLTQSNIRYDESGGLLLCSPGSRLQNQFRESFLPFESLEILANREHHLQGRLPVSGDAVRSLVEKQIKERKLICDRIKIFDRTAELSARGH